jgi:hypothetical protein
LATDLAGQPVRDKYILLTTPYNKRPLTLYRGQLQVNAGYKFAVRARAYDENGELIRLKSNGTGSVFHYYFVDVKYGLTNFMEIGSENYMLRRGVREPSTTIVSTTSTSIERVTINKLAENKGFGDIFVYTALRLPLKYRWFDLSVIGGLFIPSAEHETRKPENDARLSSLSPSNNYTINLHYNYANGFGVPVYSVSASSKLTLGKISAMAAWKMNTPMKEGTNTRWEETMDNRAFSYSGKTYSYLLSDNFSFDVSLHYQPTGWFNCWLNGSFFRTRGGWTEYWGNKYINKEKRVINLEPGFELQVSPSFIIYQVAGFPLNGKNSDAPFFLFTTLSYNMFPFLR